MVVCCLFALVSLTLFSGCEDTNVMMMTDAATDAVKAVTLSDKDVRSLAQQAIVLSDSENRVAPLNNPYSKRLLRLVAEHSERDGRVFNFKAYLIEQVNAFAVADGSIRIFSGLMDLMSDQELLFVIGHEMGHVVNDHSKKKVALAYASSAVRKGLAAQEGDVGQIARSVVGDFAKRLTNAQFSQYEERQADIYGSSFLQELGHDTSHAVSALEKLAVLANEHTFLSSHPEPGSRAERIRRAESGEEPEDDSLPASIFNLLKVIVVTLLDLLRTLINWLLSLL